VFRRRQRGDVAPDEATEDLGPDEVAESDQAPGPQGSTGRDAVIESEGPPPDEALATGSDDGSGAGGAAPAPPEAGADEDETPSMPGRLGRARRALAAPFAAIRSRGRVDDAVLDELEEALILADVGLPTTTKLMAELRSEARGKAPDELIEALRTAIVSFFAGDETELVIGEEAPSVWLFVGVNGVGKTTSIGKLARRESDRGRKIVIAAGDTFRAAAGEQLAAWAARTGTDLVEGADGADPSSVVYDAIRHAAAKNADLVLADTAGRLHTKTNLMVELEKIRRVADRDPGHVTEVLLVIDATTGQNGLVQARQFAEAVGVTGIVLTKLDGTAKGGIVLAIRADLGLPIKLVGLGEGEHDLVIFDPAEFAEALIG